MVISQKQSEHNRRGVFLLLSSSCVFMCACTRFLLVYRMHLSCYSLVREVLPQRLVGAYLGFLHAGVGLHILLINGTTSVAPKFWSSGAMQTSALALGFPSLWSVTCWNRLPSLSQSPSRSSSVSQSVTQNEEKEPSLWTKGETITETKKVLYPHGAPFIARLLSPLRPSHGLGTTGHIRILILLR